MQVALTDPIQYAQLLVGKQAQGHSTIKPYRNMKLIQVWDKLHQPLGHVFEFMGSQTAIVFARNRMCKSDPQVASRAIPVDVIEEHSEVEIRAIDIVSERRVMAEQFEESF